jgi:hypothetical protein
VSGGEWSSSEGHSAVDIGWGITAHPSGRKKPPGPIRGMTAAWTDLAVSCCELQMPRRPMRGCQCQIHKIRNGRPEFVTDDQKRFVCQGVCG